MIHFMSRWLRTICPRALWPPVWCTASRSPTSATSWSATGSQTSSASGPSLTVSAPRYLERFIRHASITLVGCQEGALEKAEHEGDDECRVECPDDDPHVCGDKSKGFLRYEIILITAIFEHCSSVSIASMMSALLTPRHTGVCVRVSATLLRSRAVSGQMSSSGRR